MTQRKSVHSRGTSDLQNIKLKWLTKLCEKKCSNLPVFRDILIKIKRYHFTAIELAKLTLTRIDKI